MMKRLNKLLAILLAVTMMMSLAVVVQADPEYTIEINNAVVGQTYSAYKIFDAVLNGTSYSYTINTSTNSVLYQWLYDNYSTNNSLTSTAEYFTFTDTSDSNVKSVSIDTTVYTEDAAAALAAALKVAINGGELDSLTPVASKTAEGTTAGSEVTVTLDVDTTDGGAGYYFVDTTLGVLTALDTVTGTQKEINDKNDNPSVDKEVSETGATGSWETDDDSDAAVGDIVYYQTTIENLKGLSALTLHDTMDAGLDLTSGSIVVTLYYTDGTAQTAVLSSTDDYEVVYGEYHQVNETETNLNEFETGVTYYTSDCNNPPTYTIVADTSGTPTAGTVYYTYCTFCIDFSNLFSTSDYADESQLTGSYIVVTYNATVTEDAVIYAGNATDSNNNSTYIEYGNSSTSIRSVVQTYVYEVNVYKWYDNSDVQTALADAEFVVWRYNPSNPTEVQYATFTKDPSEEIYTLSGWVDAIGSATPITTTSTGTFQIEGLDADVDYYLKETEAPANYNLLSTDIQFTIEGSTGSGTQGTVTYNGTETGTESLYNTIEVENKSGSELPGTGGIGTTIFYVVGGILVVGAVVLLITKKRLGNKDE